MMLHFRMCNISNFAQISSVLAQGPTATTRLLLPSQGSWKRACCLDI